MGTRAAGECFHSFFEFPPNFHECFYNSIENGEYVVLFFNTAAHVILLSTAVRTFNKLTSVFYASVPLLIMNFVISLSKYLMNTLNETPIFLAVLSHDLTASKMSFPEFN